MRAQTTDPLARRRVATTWAVALSWVGVLVGVPVVWVYRTRIGETFLWDDVWAVSATVVGVVQLVAVHLRRWTAAVAALSLITVPMAAFLLSALMIFWLGFMVVPALLPWVPALVAVLVAQRRAEQAEGGPTPRVAVRRARGWSMTAVLGGAAASAGILVTALLTTWSGWTVFWAVVAGIVAVVTLVSAQVHVRVRRGQWQAAADAAVVANGAWCAAAVVGFFVLLGPLVLLVVPTSQANRWCARLARAGAVVDPHGGVRLAAQPQVAGTSQTQA